MFFLDELRKSNISKNINIIFEKMYYNLGKFTNYPQLVPGKLSNFTETKHDVALGLLLIKTKDEVPEFSTLLYIQTCPDWIKDDLSFCQLLLKFHSDVTIDVIKSDPFSHLTLVNLDEALRNNITSQKTEYYPAIYMIKDPSCYKSCWYLTKLNGGFYKVSIDFVGNPLFEIHFCFESATRLPDEYYDKINDYRRSKKRKDLIDLFEIIIQENS